MFNEPRVKATAADVAGYQVWVNHMKCYDLAGFVFSSVLGKQGSLCWCCAFCGTSSCRTVDARVTMEVKMLDHCLQLVFGW